MSKFHRVIYYHGSIKPLPFRCKNNLVVLCGLCSHYSHNRDRCKILKINGLMKIKKLRIVYCRIFRIQEEQKLNAVIILKPVKTRKARRHIYIVKGKLSNGLPKLEIRDNRRLS